jgi:two-component system cell cycle sensor histidine kinase/response regulator CckA
VERFTRNIPGFGQLYVLRDITEQRRSEESRRRLEHVVATLKQGFAIVSLEGAKIQTTNAAFDAMHGYAAGELEGHDLFEICGCDQGQPSQAVRAILDAADGEGSWEGEVTCRRKDDSTFPASLRVNLHQGEAHRYLSLIQVDSTDQKRMQEEAAKFQTKLLQGQKLESLGLLAGGVAHDFNNLLTGIMGNTSLALDSLAPSSAIRIRLNEVLTASERAADLTRQLLAYSGKGRFIIEPIDISALVRGTNALVQVSVPRTVQVHLYLDANLPRVEADATQLQQLVMNLVINAAEAIEDKPGLVQVSTGVQVLDANDIASEFANDSLIPGPHVFIEVQDNGCGMDDATKAQIFDPFFTTKLTGRGLGLAAAVGIVRSHGGTLKVYSAPGAGSTFKVFLPIWHGELPEALAKGRCTNLFGTGTVLVVDDEETVRSTTYNALTHYGYDVMLAENGARALELFERDPDRVSVVLLDMTMPVMSGEETLRLMRKIRPELPIVLTSGFNESEAVGRFAGKGLSGFLQKPYTSSQMAGAVKSAIP